MKPQTRRNAPLALFAATVLGIAGGAVAQETPEVEPETIAALKSMVERLDELTAFSVTSGLLHEVVLESGQKLTVVEQVEMDVQKPKGMRIERTSPESSRIFYYDGETAALWGPKNGYFTAVDFTGTNRELATTVAEKYAIELPLSDLFLWSGSDEQIAAIKSAFFVDSARIGDRVCQHYAMRQEGVDWEIWIAEDGDGLPCAYAITDLTDEAHPVFRATISITPKAEIADGRFTFKQPEDALFIPLVDVAEAAKKE